jgi:bacteriorhodopsin
VNKDQYAEMIKDAALDIGKKAVMQFLVSKASWLALSWVNPFVAWIVGKVLEIAIKQTEMGMFFMYIDLRTSAQGRAFQEAAINNRNTQDKLRHGLISKEEAAKAEKELIDSFRSFVKFTT